MSRQARYVVRKADGIDGAPIPPDEPCIVIRAQDRLALNAIDHYIDLYSHVPEASGDVVDELEQHRDAIEAWQAEHPTKYADR